MNVKKKILTSLYKHDPHGKGKYGRITAAFLVISCICFIMVLVKQVA